jgi:hypothetical protein
VDDRGGCAPHLAPLRPGAAVPLSRRPEPLCLCRAAGGAALAPVPLCPSLSSASLAASPSLPELHPAAARTRLTARPPLHPAHAPARRSRPACARAQGMATAARSSAASGAWRSGSPTRC